MPEQPNSLFDGSIAPHRRAQKFVNNDIIQPDQTRPTNQLSTFPPNRVTLDGLRTRQERSKVLNRQVFAESQQDIGVAAPVVQPNDRTSIEGPSSPQKLKPPVRYSNMQIALGGLAGIMLIVGLSVSILSFQTNKQIVAKVKGVSTTKGDEGTSDVPSESKPASIASYQVAPTLPRYIRIPSIGVYARVKALGVNSKNELLAPSNIYDAGWYVNSSKPGDDNDKGAMLIDGHVHGPTYPGVFYKLKNLKPGSEISIQRGDNHFFKYEVVKVQNYDADSLDMRIAMASIKPGEHGLNLITCGGKYTKANGYSQRTIVFAVQKN